MADIPDDETPATEPTFDSRAAWIRLQQQMHARPPATASPHPARRSIAKAATFGLAGLVVAAGVVTVLFAHRFETATQTASHSHTIAVGYGERDTITLSDATLVILDAGSVLRVDDHYGVARREVFLDGQAYFDVTRDPQRPFHVHAAGAVVNVLGTRFAVRSDSTQQLAEVSVARGRVALAAEQDSTRGIVLGAGDVGRMIAGRPSLVLHGDTALSLGWLSGLREIRAMPLAELLPQLRRWYGIEARTDAPDLAASRLTATFTNESAHTVVSMLAQLLDADVVMRVDTVVFAARSR